MHYSKGQLPARAFLVALLLAGLLWSCSGDRTPSPADAQEIMSTRSLGLAFLEEGRLAEAESTFTRLTELADNEPLGFANLGLVHMRNGD